MCEVCLSVCCFIYLSVCLPACLPAYLSVYLSVCLSICLSVLDVGSVVFYFVLCGKTNVRGLREQEFQVNVCGFSCYRRKKHCCPSGLLSLSFVSTCLQCHLLCQRSVFTFLLVDYVTVCCRSRLYTHLFSLSELGVCLRLAAGWSPVVISLSHYLLMASVGVCYQSGLCMHLFLLSELGVHLRLTVGLSFVTYSSSTHLLVSTFALDGLVFDFDIIQVH